MSTDCPATPRSALRGQLVALAGSESTRRFTCAQVAGRLRALADEYAKLGRVMAGSHPEDE